MAMEQMSSRGGGATAGGQIGEFQPPEPRPKVVRAVSGSSQFWGVIRTKVYETPNSSHPLIITTLMQ